MRREILLTLSFTVIVLTGFVIENGKDKTIAAPHGFALIELYSSEGCSSCPPAESLMKRLIHKADSASLPVYIIEFHVDYWDRLGWKDTLDDHAYSLRQQKYGDHFKLNSIYTPQAIVNGEHEMVGSDESKINTAINAGLSVSPTVTINCKVNKEQNSKVQVDYTLTGNTAGSFLNFAVVESNLTTSIKRGENANKTMTHDNVARVFESIQITSSSGKTTISIPHVNAAHSKLICFVQSSEDMSILAATQYSLGSN
jgi:hypothetical protein